MSTIDLKVITGQFGWIHWSQTIMVNSHQTKMFGFCGSLSPKSSVIPTHISGVTYHNNVVNQYKSNQAKHKINYRVLITSTINLTLKQLVSAIFYFSPNDSPSKTMKNAFDFN